MTIKEEKSFKKIRKKIEKENKSMLKEIRKHLFFSGDEHLLSNDLEEFVFYPLGFDDTFLFFYDESVLLGFPFEEILKTYSFECVVDDLYYSDKGLVPKTFAFFFVSKHYGDFDKDKFLDYLLDEFKHSNNIWADILDNDELEEIDFYASLFLYDKFKKVLSNIEDTNKKILNSVIESEKGNKFLSKLLESNSEIFVSEEVETEVENNKEQKTKI